VPHWDIGAALGILDPDRAESEKLGNDPGESFLELVAWCGPDGGARQG